MSGNRNIVPRQMDAMKNSAISFFLLAQFIMILLSLLSILQGQRSNSFLLSNLHPDGGKRSNSFFGSNLITGTVMPWPVLFVNKKNETKQRAQSGALFR